jgi:hypothetical protein
MKKIGIAQGVPEGLAEAVASRYQGEVEQVISANENIGYEFVVAYDDLPVPPGVPIRRYVTHMDVVSSEWSVVAARHLLPEGLRRGTQWPIVAPLPVESRKNCSRDAATVAVLNGKWASEISVRLKSHGIDIEEVAVAGTPSLVIDGSSGGSGIYRIRFPMAAEIPVVGLVSNACATDTIRHQSNGLLGNSAEEIVLLASELLKNKPELKRLGFEARATVAEASWGRVARALLHERRVGYPELEQLGSAAKHHRWVERLGHAAEWKNGHLLENVEGLAMRQLNGGRQIDLKMREGLRKKMLERLIGKADSN